MEDICPPEVEEFIIASEVDESSTMALLECTRDVQARVMKMGPLAGKPNASELLLKRIKAAQLSYGGAAQHAAAAAATPNEATPDEAVDGSELDDFIIRNTLDEKAANVLRALEPDLLAGVIEKGDLTGAKNPSAAVLSRVRDVRNVGKKGTVADGGKGAGGGAREYGKGLGKDLGKELAWGGGAGGAGGPPAKQWQASQGEGTPPTVLRLELPPNVRSPLMHLSPDGPAVIWQKGAGAIASAVYMLSELVGDVNTSVQIDHDPEWTQFPEVAVAVKRAGGEDHCVAVAKCPSQGKWAVGLSANWKGRESAARLALVVAITAGTNKMYQLGKTYPEFMDMCVYNGICPPPESCPPPAMNPMGKLVGKLALGKLAMGKGMGMEMDPWSMPPMPVKGKGARGPAWGGGSPVANPTPPVHWLALMQDSEITRGGYQPECPAICHDKALQDIFSQAGDILYTVVGENYNNCEFKHDTEWDIFPEVGQAMKAAGTDDNCFCVASCPQIGKWAVGIGAGKKPREKAAQLALAVAIAMETGPTVQSMKHPEIASLCESAIMAAQGGGPNKRRRR